MTERSQDSRPGSTAEELFARWLAGRESAEPQEFEALCRAHPQHAGELCKLHEEWQRIEALMRKAGLGVALAAGVSLARKLVDEYGSGVDPNVSLHEEEERSGGPPTSQLLKRLREHALKSTRYRLHGEIARGGMGAILKVWDEDLRRNLAMKVILGKAESSTEGKTTPVDRRVLARFLEEAQVTGQLDHPGIVPVHELGLDAEGRVYFTMKLVKGRDLKQIFELAFEEQEGWNETRALGVILKVCEAMAYAHKKRVIHRDLKPANVMVGSFGEVFVMDWGLARVLGQRDTHDLRLQPMAATSSLATDRREERQDAPDSPLFTMDGDVVGTPCYMPPEQARGEIEKLSARSDVYSIGAMLYHLLAREMPYCPPDVRVTNRTVLGMLLHGPPASIESLRKGVPAELVAISEKAMKREASERYADTQALAEDLRAYLEGRVVRAYETGAWAEARKWVQRNRPLAAALAGAAALLVVGLTTSLVFKARADERSADLQAANTTIQSRNTELAAATRSAQKSEQVAKDREREATEKSRALEVANADLAIAKDNAEEQAYVANFIAADTSLRSNDVAEGKRRLEACNERLRGWEWRYLHLASDTSLVVLRGHEKGVTSIAFSPDGSRIVSGSYDKTVRVWNATTGENLLVLRGDESSTAYSGSGPVDSVAFSPDGSRIVSGSYDGQVRVWDTTSGENLLVLYGHEAGGTSVAFSPDGSRIVSGSYDKTVRVWNATSGDSRLILRGHDDRVTSVAFSPDGSRIVSGSGDKTVRVWNATTGEAKLILRGHDDRVTSVAFSPDGSRIVSGSGDKTVRVWNATTGESLLVLRGHDLTVESVAFSSDGSRIVSGSGDKTARIWIAASGENLLVLPGVVDSVAFSPDGSRIVSGSQGRSLEDMSVRVSNSTTGEDLLVLRGHSGGHFLGGYNAGAQIVFSSDRSIAFSPDGSHIAFTGDKTVRVCNVASDEDPIVLRGHDSDVSSVSYSPEGARIVSGSADKTVRLWDATSGENLRVMRGHENIITSVAFSPEGSRIVSSSEDKTVRVWNATSGENLLVMRGHDDGVTSVAFSPDCSRIVSGSADKTVRVWNATSGENLLVLRGHDEGVTSVTFSPDCSRIVSGSADKTVRVWNARRGENLLVLRGHDGEVTSVAYSPDGSRIASGSLDRTVRVWESSPAMIHDPTREAAVAAAQLVHSLLDRLVLVEDVVHHLQIDDSLREEMRSVAIRLARSHEDDPRQLNDLSWSVVKLPHEEPQAYERAARLAEAASGVKRPVGPL